MTVSAIFISLINIRAHLIIHFCYMHIFLTCFNSWKYDQWILWRRSTDDDNQY